MCPYFEYLDELFSAKVNLNPVAIFESGRGSVIKNEEPELIIDDSVSIDFGLTEHEADASNDTIDMDESSASCFTPRENDDNGSELFAVAKRMQTKPRSSANNASSMLMQITQMRSDMQEKKLKLEERKISLEEKRLAQEFELKKMEIEARKMEAENVRLQLLRIDDQTPRT